MSPDPGQRARKAQPCGGLRGSGSSPCDSANMSSPLRGTVLASDFTYEQAAQPCDDNLLTELKAATHAINGEVPMMPSGATHDALAMSELCPKAVLFVRCRDGASHLPEEFASDADM